MKKVTIYKTRTPEMDQVPVVEALFDEAGQVTFTGDQTIIANLAHDGIPDHENREKTLFPADGLPFLENLKYSFSSGYLNATDVTEA